MRTTNDVYVSDLFTVPMPKRAASQADFRRKLVFGGCSGLPSPILWKGRCSCCAPGPLSGDCWLCSAAFDKRKGYRRCSCTL